MCQQLAVVEGMKFVQESVSKTALLIDLPSLLDLDEFPIDLRQLDDLHFGHCSQ